MKKLLTILFALGLFAGTTVSAFSLFTVPQGGTGAATLSGCLSGNGTGAITGSGVACGSGGGSGGGTWATTTSTVSGRSINYPLATTDIVCIGGTATTTCSFYFDPNILLAALTGGIEALASSTIQNLHTTTLTLPALVSGQLNVNASGVVYKDATTTFSSGLTYLNGGVTCDVATASVKGCLASADWSVFNNKVSSSSLSGTSPVTYSAITGAIGCATCALTSSIFAYPFTSATTFTGVSTSTLLNLAGGVMSNASSTFQNLLAGTLNIAPLTSSGLGIDSSHNVYAAATTTFSTGLLYANGAVTCVTGTAAVFGCLPAADFTRFNGNAPFPFTSATTYTGVSTSTLLNLAGGIMSNASSTFQNLNVGSLTHPSLLSSGLAVNSSGVDYAAATTTFSTGLTYAAGAVTCNTATGAVFGCLASADWTKFNSAMPFPFTQATTYAGVSTSTLAGFLGGLMSTGSSTIQTLNSASSTLGTVLITNASTTNQYISGTLTLNTSTTTANNGFNLTNGCFAINGTCVSGSGGSTNAAGGTGAVQFANGTAFAGDNTNFFWNNAVKFLGIGTSTPMWNLQIASSTGSQLTLTDPSQTGALQHWSLRSQNGSLFFSTSSAATFATSSPAALTLLQAGGIKVGGVGTSTFGAGGSGGIDLQSGCFSILTVCFGSGGSLTGAGSSGNAAFWTSANNLSNDANFFWDNTGKNLGLASSTPGTVLSIGATGAGINILANATSTFAKGINLNAGCFAILGACLSASSIGAASFAYPFTSATTYTGVSTSTLLNLAGGVMSNASSTFQNLNVGSLTQPSLSVGALAVSQAGLHYSYSTSTDGAFLYATSTMGTGTTTLKVSGLKTPTIFTSMGCSSVGGGTFVARLGNSTASSTSVLSSTGLTTTFTTLSTNNSFATGVTFWFEIGSVSGAVTNPTCSYTR